MTVAGERTGLSRTQGLASAQAFHARYSSHDNSVGFKAAAMTAMDAKIFSWGVRALYVGPGFNVSAHRTGVSVLCCGLGGQFSVATNPADARKRLIRCRTLCSWWLSLRPKSSTRR